MTRKVCLTVALVFMIFMNTAAWGDSISPLTALSAEADRYTGSANFSVPVKVPAGRAGIQPNINILYNSTLPNGPLGMGWALEFGSIQRSTRYGPPKYDNTDAFVLSQNGGTEELVFDPATNTYHAQTEGAFMKIVQTGGHWEVTDKKGVTYYFGETAAAQEYDPANSAHVFKWCLDKVEDLAGNNMTLTYARDGNTLYPDTVNYTGNSHTGAQPFAQVAFTRISRLPERAINYVAGFERRTEYLISQISVSVEGNLQSRIDLNYHSSHASGRSLLDTVTQYGADGTSSLPPVTLQYQEYVDEIAPWYEAASQGSSSGAELFGDFNGDGKVDKAYYYASQEKFTVALSTGTSFAPATTWRLGFPSNAQVLEGDFNKDGRMDIVMFVGASGYGNWKVFLSDGTKLIDSGYWIYNFGGGEIPGTGDFNGDGLTDIVTFYMNNGYQYPRFALNTGSGFVPANVPAYEIDNGDNTPVTADFNGDGLTDIATYAKGSGYWKVSINPGDLTQAFVQLPTVWYGNSSNGNGMAGDFNGDGLTDIGFYHTAAGQITYLTSEGDHFGAEQTVPFDFSVYSANTQVRVADLSGDGLPDFAAVRGDGSGQLAYSHGVFPDLLDSVGNGVGGTTLFQYTPSTQGTNQFLPFPLQVVSAVTRSNAQGDSYTASYSYEGGLWAAAPREFRGFATVRVTDAQGNYAETHYLQDDIYRRQIAEQDSYDSAGNLYSRAVNTWDHQEVIPGSNFAYLQRKDNFVYDGDSTGRRTAEEFYYEETPQLGDLTKAVQLGEVDLDTGADIGADTRTVETAYVQNTSGGNWLAGLPRLTTVKDNAGQTVRQTWFYYDGQGNTAAPLEGLLTRKEDDTLLPGTISPATQYSYDGYGNLLSTTDPKGNVTAIAYDTSYHIFPVATTNALGHSVVNEYYGIDGVALDDGSGLHGLWGQLKSTTDPNNQAGRRVYDTFGRLSASISPLDSVSYPTSTSEIQYFVDHIQETTSRRINHGQPETVDTVNFYDGLGRLIETKSPSAVAGQYVLSGQAEYDSRGLKEIQYLPRFTTTAFDALDTIDPAQPHTAVTYDAMGRPTETLNADSTRASVAYDDWTTVTTDENGHKQESVHDAYGRLIEKHEYTGADGRSPNYPAQSYALYATTRYSYDSEGNLTTTIDAHGNTTTISYDNLGRKIAMDDPDMGHWTYRYDANGNLTSQTDAKGQALTFTYDALNRLVHKTDGGTLNVNYTYDDPFVVNSKGRLTQAAYGSTGDKTDFAYDEVGRELQSVKTINAQAFNVQRGYDALNRLLQVQYPDGASAFYKYNAAGQIQAVANDPSLLPADGGTPPPPPPPPPVTHTIEQPFTQYTFNESAANTTVTDAGTGGNNGTANINTGQLSVGGKIDHSFHFIRANKNYVNVNAMAAAVKGDTTGTVSFWLYLDSMPLKGNGYYIFALGDSDGDAFAAAYVRYDGLVFNLDHLTDGAVYWQGVVVSSGSWIHITIVQDGTALKIYKNGVDVTPAENHSGGGNPGKWFSWIASLDNGNISRLIFNGNGSQGGGGFLDGKVDDFRYYPRALTAEEAQAIYNGGAGTEDGEITYTTLSWNGSAKTDVRLARAASGSGFWGRAKRYFSRAMDVLAAFNIFRVEEAYAQEDPALYVSDVEYNAAGQATKITYGNGNVTEYTYNMYNLRLVRLYTTSNTGTVLQDLQYTYDSVGNVLSIIDNVNTASQTFQYDEQNRLVHAQAPQSYGTKDYQYDEIGNIAAKDGKFYSYAEGGAGPHAVTSLSDGTTMTYDQNGNMATKQKGADLWQYSYDGENRLVEVKKNSAVIADYEYDGDGGRTRKITADGTTEYVGSLFETSGTRNTKFIFLGDQRVASITNGEVLYYHADHLGGTNVLTDALGAEKELIEYQPFGSESRHEKYGSSQEVAWYYFTGKPKDDETGLMFYGARYYDPALGKFISPDSIVQSPGNPQTLNRYSYAGNNPVSNIDPTGHSFWKKFGKWITAAAIAVVGTVLTIASGGALAPVIGTYWAGVATGAMAGATIGGTFAAATGGNIGMGMLTGAVGGGLFAGLAPGLSTFSNGIFRGISLGGAAGPLTSGMSMASNFVAGFLGGAASGAAVAGINGADVGQGALMGGAFAGGFSLLSDTAYMLRTREIKQCELDPSGQNLSGKSAGIRGDRIKLGGARFDPRNPNAAPAPFGGIQGGQGKIFGFNYPPNGVINHVIESWAGPHDWLNGWTYDSIGNLRSMNLFEKGINTITNPLNVAIAAPLAVPLATEPIGGVAPVIIYGESNRRGN